jgi:hypothetical protein
MRVRFIGTTVAFSVAALAATACAGGGSASSTAGIVPGAGKPAAALEAGPGGRRKTAATTPVSCSGSGTQPFIGNPMGNNNSPGSYTVIAGGQYNTTCYNYDVVVGGQNNGVQVGW